MNEGDGESLLSFPCYVYSFKCFVVGSAWAFSAVSAIEGWHRIQTGSLVALSVQELLECDTARSHGRGGGYTELAFDFVVKNGGIAAEDRYPYTGCAAACNNHTMFTFKDATITGYGKVPPNDEGALKEAVAGQPVAVIIKAEGKEFMFYNGGLYVGPCQSYGVNHEVTVVGYGEIGWWRRRYWLVKNYWGTDWGEQGYIRMARGMDQPGGLCGIATYPIYPV